MMLRLITGIVAFAVALFFLYMGGWWFVFGIAAVAALGIFEMYRALKNRHSNIIIWPSYVMLALSIPAVVIYGEFALAVIFCVCVFAVFSAVVFTNKIAVPDALASVFCLAYPTLPFTLFFVLAMCPEPEQIARIGTVLAFFGAIAADMFGIYTGQLFGRHKLAPRISPKKTIEGAVGGGVMSVLVCLVSGILFSEFYSDELPVWSYAVVGALVAGSAIMGDLIASVVKRYCDIKDYGKLFPGHGGVMDRFDSILFSALVIVCFYSITFMF